MLHARFPHFAAPAASAARGPPAQLQFQVRKLNSLMSKFVVKAHKADRSYAIVMNLLEETVSLVQASGGYETYQIAALVEHQRHGRRRLHFEVGRNHLTASPRHAQAPPRPPPPPAPPPPSLFLALTANTNLPDLMIGVDIGTSN
jgi:hypothetical protein